MNSLWFKIKLWTKITLFALLALYILVFIIKNSGHPVKFWYWYRGEPMTNVLVLVFFSFLAGVISTLLVRALFKTVQQIREARQRSQTDRLQREVQDMHNKASMLQTKPHPAEQPPSP